MSLFLSGLNFHLLHCTMGDIKCTYSVLCGKCFAEAINERRRGSQVLVRIGERGIEKNFWEDRPGNFFDALLLAILTGGTLI